MNQIKDRKRRSINQLLSKEALTNIAHRVAFRSWIEIGYNRGYKDAIAHLESKYMSAILKRVMPRK